MRALTAAVAIVGDWAVGCYAALNLQKNGINPLIGCEQLVGKFGAPLFAGNLVISGRLLGNADETVKCGPIPDQIAARYLTPHIFYCGHLEN